MTSGKFKEVNFFAMNLSIDFGRLFTLFAIMGLLFPIASVAEEVGGSIEWHVTTDPGSELQLEVRQMPLDRVLKTVTAKTGVPIHYSSVPEGLVSATCVGSELKQVMECLLARQADLIVRYRKPGKHTQTDVSVEEPVAEMWVLGSRFGNAPTCLDESPHRAMDNSPFKAAGQEGKADEEEADATDDLLKQAESQDVENRVEAISALMSAGRKGDPNVKKILEESLKDENPRVRAQAISSLALREGASETTAAIEEALHDGDAEVRLKAVDVAGDDRSLLLQAINDADETVRELAQSKLERLQNKVE